MELRNSPASSTSPAETRRLKLRSMRDRGKPIAPLGRGIYPTPRWTRDNPIPYLSGLQHVWLVVKFYSPRSSKCLHFLIQPSGLYRLRGKPTDFFLL